MRGLLAEAVSSLDSEQRRKLAKLCKVQPATVDRWADGTATPGKTLVKLIIARINQAGSIG